MVAAVASTIWSSHSRSRADRGLPYATGRGIISFDRWDAWPLSELSNSATCSPSKCHPCSRLHPPGTVYAAGVTSDGTVGLYRVEVSVSSGTGKLKLAGGVAGAMKELVQRASRFLQAKKTDLGVARELDVSGIHVEVIDLLANRVEAELGVAFFVACYSALRKAPVSPAPLILGDMSVQGNIKPLRSLTEPMQGVKDNGAKRDLIPIENKRNFLDLSADIMEHVDPIFFGDPKTAAMKALGG
jgi:ATP-dependent Lon protease